jgi:hypothetical protein
VQEKQQADCNIRLARITVLTRHRVKLSGSSFGRAMAESRFGDAKSGRADAPDSSYEKRLLLLKTD